MKNKIFKSFVATFALVATLAVVPMVSANAASAVEIAPRGSCIHASLTMTKLLDEDYRYVDYQSHYYIVEAEYRCNVCGEFFTETHSVLESHYDDDGDGMCECGQYVD